MLDKKKFTHLESLAAKLNQVSDGINDQINSLNAMLNKMGIGVAVFLGVLLDETTELIGDGEDREETRAAGEELGYAKANGEWQLCVRHMVYRVVNETYEPIHTGHAFPLVNASRKVRLEACGYFDELIDELARQMERYIADVEKARTLIK